MMHVASYSVPERPAAAEAGRAKPVAAKPAAAKPDRRTVKTGQAPAATKPVKTATADPLAPLSGARRQGQRQRARGIRRRDQPQAPIQGQRTD